MKTVAAVLALISFAGCLVAPMLFFAGELGRPMFEGVFLATSIGWFVGATFWASRMEDGVAEDVLSS